MSDHDAPSHASHASRLRLRPCSHLSLLAGAALGAGLAAATPAFAQVIDNPGQGVTPAGVSASPQPLRIEQVGAWGGPVNCFAREGNVGVLGSGERLIVIDMTDPMNYLELGAVRLGSPVMDVAFRDGFAYVATAGIDDNGHGPRNHLGMRGPHIVDVRDPANPVLAWSYKPDDAATYRWKRVKLYSNANGNLAIIQKHGSDDNYPQALEISDPSNPVAYTGSRVWRFESGSGFFIRPYELVIQGDLMYTFTELSGASRVLIYDLSAIDPDVRPMYPELVGYLDFAPGQLLTNIAVEGDRAYVTVDYGAAGDRQSVVAIDVSNPASPSVVSEYDDFWYPNGSDIDVAASGGLVYVVDPTHGPGLFNYDVARGLVVLDMQADPTVLGEYKGRAAAFKGLHVEGNTVYLFDMGEGLVAVDAADPADPVRLGGYHSPAALRRMDKQGDLLYVSDAWNGFTILDVANPSSPQVVGVYQSVPDGVNSWGLQVENGLAYLTVGPAGLEIVDVADPANPTLVGAMRVPPYGAFMDGRTEYGQAGGVKVIDTVAYLGARVGGPGWSAQCVFSMDVSNPGEIVPLDPEGQIIDGDVMILSFEHDPHRALLFGTGIVGSGDLISVDTSDPTNLVVDEGVGSLTASAVAASLDADRGILSVIDGTTDIESGGLYLVDVTDHLTPVLLSYTPMYRPGAVTNHQWGPIVIAEAPEVAPDNWTRALLFDTTDPASPSLHASAPVFANAHASNAGPAPGSDVLAESDMIYVAGGNSAHGLGTRAITGLAICRMTGRPRDRGDRNGDGVLDTRDLVQLLSDVKDGRSTADMNGDGRVDSRDVVEYMRLFVSNGAK